MRGSGSLIDLKVARTGQTYAEKNNITVDIALEEFLGSVTYQALVDLETGLYLEVFEFVYDLFLEERGEL